jgi:hypothetical protein
MIGQILSNNNERCYSNFSPTFREVNTPMVWYGMVWIFFPFLFLSLIRACAGHGQAASAAKRMPAVSSICRASAALRRHLFPGM